jgi:hypothetical protein
MLLNQKQNEHYDDADPPTTSESERTELLYGDFLINELEWELNKSIL